jgi:cobalt-zinc-cadmium efflux system outer membrane protein
VELQITAEVTQAYYLYSAKEKQMEQYEQGLVANAEKILQGRIYSYQRGESGLIEVLNAQRTYNDLRKEYYETLNDYSSALVELERSAAIWDLE